MAQKQYIEIKSKYMHCRRLLLLCIIYASYSVDDAQALVYIESECPQSTAQSNTYDCRINGTTYGNINCGMNNGNNDEKKNNEIGTLDKPIVTEEVGKMTSFINGIKKVFSDMEKAIIDAFNAVLRLK